MNHPRLQNITKQSRKIKSVQYLYHHGFFPHLNQITHNSGKEYQNQLGEKQMAKGPSNKGSIP